MNNSTASGSTTGNTIISLRRVSTGHHAEDKTNYVLHDISLNIRDNEFVIVFGPSGSGKTSLLHVIAGLEVPLEGEVMVGDRRLSHLTDDLLTQYHRSKLGIVFHDFNLVGSLCVWENVALPLTMSGIRFNERKQEALKLLTLLKIEHCANKSISELTGGEHQRVAIARALINNPALLLLDEPTDNLDSASAAEIISLIRDLHTKSHHSIVMTTHNPEYISLATQVIRLKDGSIEGMAKAQKANYQTKPVLPDQHYDELGTYKEPLSTATYKEVNQDATN